ncbi:hypothetical protein AGMMS50293_15500 [Spirochaetia bacterium]|nr:hypothetical protein AGMMS50293_15500 [Spirochaetia bacterium]
MRKSLPLFAVISVVVLTLGIACKKEPSNRSGSAGDEGYHTLDAAVLGDTWANNAAIEAAFTLDYRKQTPETATEEERLNLSRPSDLRSDSAQAGGNRIVGGGLRKLSDYKTDYFSGARLKENLEAIQKLQAAATEGTIAQANPGRNSGANTLTVADWGPRGEYSAQNQRPSIYVVFSQPMMPLSALGGQSDTSPLVTISPRPKGVFRWYGTSFLSFEGSEPLQSQQTYTISVNKNAQSIYGAIISGDLDFTFTTETLSMLDIIPGEDFKRQNREFYFNLSDVPPPAARFISIRFNYPVTAEDMKEFISISEGNAERPFTLKTLEPNKLLAQIDGEISFEKNVSVTLKKGAKSKTATRGTADDNKKSFSTPGAFIVKDFDRRVSYGRYRNLLDIEFTYMLDEKSVTPSSIRTEPVMNISGDNIEVWGRTLRVYNLPIGYGDKFKIYVSDNIKDRYGRALGSEYSKDIVVPKEPEPEGDVHFLNSWRNVVMLEAQFAPRYLIEYKNIAPGSYWAAEKINNPLYRDDHSNAPRNILPLGEKNAKYFADIDLKPFVNSGGYGFVDFFADINLLPKLQKPDRYGREYYSADVRTAIQVTDIGLSVRYGFNKIVIMAASLATGKPIKGAEIRAISPVGINEHYDIDMAPYFGSAKTDANGMAVIKLGAGDFRGNVNQSNNGAPYIYAQTTAADGSIDDRAVFKPNSHSPWRFSVMTGSPLTAERIIPVAFLFSDRGLYKPGETITFRGVDRSKVLGQFAIYQGPYEVILQKEGYDGEQILSLEGETSESGGFWGQFKIPETQTPGAYSVRYHRLKNGETGSIASTPITVAFFERLKFQAEMRRPAATVISGDEINTTLSATYLSGGSLAGALYNAVWYRDISYFHPETAETRGFTFGPRRSGDGRRYISDSSGALSGDGTAKITQKTGDESVKGAPYLYRAEASVTDISNQQVAATMSVTVHPARFYVGVRRQNKGGFPKTGQEASFDYITVSAEGEKTKDGSLFLPSGAEAGTMTAIFYREEWRRVQQSGVNGYVYNEYIREEVVDNTQKIKMQSGGGSFKFKPSSAGYYILRVSAQDRDGKTALTEFTFYVTGGNGGWWNSDNANEIRLVPDQNKYNPGDTAVVMMQSEIPAGQYLITVEREGIYTEEVRYIESSTSEIEIPIARNYVPVVYVAVSSFSVRSGPPAHEYGSPDLDKPKGYFGVCRIFVDPAVRSFSVTVDSGKKSFKPGEEVSMTLTATQNGVPLKNAELTLMVVDRGVLDLINYHVPNPIDYFYNEEYFPLSVSGGDSREMLMDPVTYSIKNLQGGDSDDSKIEERADFNPTAVFEPALITDENGRVTCKFKLPDTLTTYRVTVFGIHGDIFSLKESEIAAQNLINVREVLPRRLRERDTAETAVLVTNLDDKPHKVSVSLRLAPPRNIEDEETGRRKPAGEAFIDGESERELTVAPGANVLFCFDIAAVKQGYVSLEWTSRSDVLNERLVNELRIEHPIIMEAFTTTGSVGAEERSATEALVIPSFADQNVGSLTLTLDATRLATLESSINYLFHYPYGCMEQRSAAILPLVIFGDYLDALSLKSEVSNPRKVIESELKSWVKAQLSDGSFPYWPDGTTGNDYVSLRIAHILAIAKSKNINIPKELNVNKLLDYLESNYRKMAAWTAQSQWYSYRDYYGAWTMYVFALHGREVDSSRLAAIVSRNDIDVSALAMAGLAYRYLGKNAEAAAAANKLRGVFRQTTRGVDISNAQSGNYYWSFFNKPTEQLALSLEFFVQQLPGDDINTRILYTLLQNKRAGEVYWDNTAVTTRVLSAVDALIRAENLEKLNVNAAVSLNAAELLSGSFKGLGAKPVTSVTQFGDAPLKDIPRDKLQSLVINKDGNGAIYYTAELRYAIPQELQSYRDEGLGLYMSIIDVETNTEVKDTALRSGKTYRVRIKLSSSHNRTYVALRAPIPSGAEFLDATFTTTPAAQEERRADEEIPWSGSGSWISHQEIYDNEIHYFYNTLRSGETEISFLFRTPRRGVYPTPSLTAECMYEPEIFGRTAGVLWTIE